MTLTRAGRLLAVAALNAALADPAFAAKFTDTEHTSIEEPRPPDVPSDEALEATGAVIGSIDIDVRNIFDERDPREDTGIYHLANHLHLRTKKSSIQAQLLFASGEKYQARKLAETERNLRLLSYLYDARVVPVRYADGKVDIKVITKDVWTLSPGVSVGRAGGRNSTNFDVADSNFLGYGKAIQVARSSDVDRTSNVISWSDPNVWGSHWTSGLEYADSTDGSQRTLQFGQPFYSFDTPWSTKVSVSTFDRTVSRYALGNIVDQFNDDQSTYELSGGISSGWVDGWTRRLLFGLRYDRNYFLAAPMTSLPARQLPPDRTLSYPFVGFDIVQDDYTKTGDQNQIGRTEDLYFGTEVTGEVGFADGAFGADRSAVMLAATAVHGWQLTREQQLFLSSKFSSRVEEGNARNLIFDNSAKYYLRWREDWLLYVALSATVTNALDPDAQLLLGGDNGLRGYPLRYESGSSRALLTIEQRVFTDWYPFRLVRVGAAVFSDVGRTWGAGVVGNSDPGLLRDAGFGLRLGNTRSGLGNVLHVDMAFPLNALPGIQRVQFLVQTFKSF